MSAKDKNQISQFQKKLTVLTNQQYDNYHIELLRPKQSAHGDAADAPVRPSTRKIFKTAKTG